MNAKVVLISVGLMAVVAAGMVYVAHDTPRAAQQAVVEGKPEAISLPTIPSWLTKLLGGGGVLSVIVGFLSNWGNKPTPIPGSGLVEQILNTIKQAQADGKIDETDLPLLINLIKVIQGGGSPLVDPNPNPNVQPAPLILKPTTDQDRLQLILNNIFSLTALDALMKAEGMPNEMTLKWPKGNEFLLKFGTTVTPTPTPKPVA